ncbi:MAG: hypothetical protein AAFQ01_04220 [Bacteroidota bacterium]
MKEIFVAIQNKIINQVPQFKFVDLDLGQVDQEPLPPLNYPAALVAFTDSLFTDLSELQQQAEVVIIVRLAFREYERTHSVAAEEYREVGLAHLDLIDSIKWALHGLSGPSFTQLSHTGFSTEPRADLRVYQLSFSTLYTAEPPTDANQTNYVPWSEAGGQGVGPDLCIQDEENESLLS